jgi:hypothetical protein
MDISEMDLTQNENIGLILGSQWWRGIWRGSGAAGLLGLRVRIPPRAWISLPCGCCVLLGRGLCVGLITCPGEFHRVWCVWVWSWSLDNEETLAHWGLLHHWENILISIIYPNYKTASCETVIYFTGVLKMTLGNRQYSNQLIPFLGGGGLIKMLIHMLSLILFCLVPPKCGFETLRVQFRSPSLFYLLVHSRCRGFL